MSSVSETLEQMTADELRSLARKLNLTGYSNLRKPDLIALIKSTDTVALSRLVFPTWWQRYHNHVYGIAGLIGLLLTVVAFLPSPDKAPVAAERAAAVQSSASERRTIEKPIKFVDFADLSHMEKERVLDTRRGEQFVWEGFLVGATGFDPGALEGVPYDKPVAISLVPTTSNSPQIVVECRFAPIEPTDYGVDLAIQLNRLMRQQRIRVSGMLAGTAEKPALDDASLEAVFPLGE